ncbi:MAG: phosphonate metabolism protein PhnP [Nevskiaceae bacterium]|nr:phosphonate metabolism protein PhnP [Nevskiaceae bacterium]
MANVQVAFLGTGDSGGVPLYGCDCAACARARNVPALRRGPCSALVESGNTRVLLDAGLTDLAERFPPGSLTAIVLTHFHADHVQGLFHLRWGMGAPISVFSPPDPDGCADLYKNRGILNFVALEKFVPFSLGELRLTPLPLIHSKLTFGYFIEDMHGPGFAYLTDTLGLPQEAREFLRSRKFDLALDCSHPPQTAARNHNDLTTALEIVTDLAPRRAWLTHIGHDMDAWLLAHEQSLPDNVSVARDGGVAFGIPGIAPEMCH